MTPWHRGVDLIVPIVVGTLLTAGFWWPLFLGAGFVGGDVYNYFLPLKQFYAEGLRAGEWRFWHPGIGNGVPVLGESQTGFFYPFHLLVYHFLDVHTAYHVSFLGHYVLGYFLAYVLARRLPTGRLAALAGATIFVFGWFPARSCLEWAMVTGAWLPGAILCTMEWLRQGQRRWGLGVALITTAQLLAGHFQLAFVTVLSVTAVSLFWQAPNGGISWWRRGAVAVWLLVGFGCAAPQLIPTWQLKIRSQRAENTFGDTIEYGRIPPAYLLQAVIPWIIHADSTAWLHECGGNSNIVEAHLCFGSLPLLLLVVGLFKSRGALATRPWLFLAVFGVILATGIFSPLLRHWPGFGFFRYPGRYGLMTQLAAALGCALAADSWLKPGRRLRRTLFIIGLLVTCGELYWIAQQVQFVTMVRPAPWYKLPLSSVGARLQPTDRVLAMDGNTLALTGASCVPPYLGMGPAEYYKWWARVPDVFHGRAVPTAEVIGFFHFVGITHVLTEHPLTSDWPMEFVWAGHDPFLHPRWGRSPSQPLYLYRIKTARGRVTIIPSSTKLDGISQDNSTDHQLPAWPPTDDSDTPISSAVIQVFTAHRIVVECQMSSAASLVLSDLLYPGWQARVDNQPVTPRTDIPWRVVDLPPGVHQVEWLYSPPDFYLGVAIALATMILTLLGLFLYHPNTQKAALH